MRIITKDGAVFSGQPREIVTAMRVSSWSAETYPENGEFKRACAARVKLWNSVEIRTEDDRNFLADLELAGLITVEGE